MMEGSVWVAPGDHPNNTNSNNNSNNNYNNLWGFSHESEHDLALMVSDFVENNGGSAGGDSWCSSDSESGFSDLIHLADKISSYKHSVGQYENDLLSMVHSLILSISETDLHFVKSGPCNASCIRYSLVKLFRLSGYDAAVCASRWQGSGKVPGGDHEYIDVVNYNNGWNNCFSLWLKLLGRLSSKTQCLFLHGDRFLICKQSGTHPTSGNLFPMNTILGEMFLLTINSATGS